jgi:hypothetical protein
MVFFKKNNSFLKVLVKNSARISERLSEQKYRSEIENVKWRRGGAKYDSSVQKCVSSRDMMPSLLGVFKPGALPPVAHAPSEALARLCFSPPMAEKPSHPLCGWSVTPSHRTDEALPVGVEV